MKIRLHMIVFWIIMFIFSSSFFCANKAYTETDVKEGSDTTKFEYHQRPISKVTKKDVKVRVAISRFEDKTEIEGSPFNVEEDEEDESERTRVDIKEHKVTIEIDKKKEEEKEISKKELLTGLLTDALYNTGKFEIIERGEINELIREINFQNSKWVKNENIGTLGNIFGVQYIITGDILRNEDREKIGRDYYALAIRMYNVNTGEIVSSSATNSPYLKEAVDTTVKDLASQIRSKAWTCRVVGVSDTGVYINGGLRDNLEKRDVFYVCRVENEIIDPETKETLGFENKNVGLIEVEEVLDENLSRTKVLEEKEKITIGDIVSAERIDEKKKSELELWRRIYGTQEKGKEISGKDLDRYSLTTYDFSPEDIMENFGKSVVKIQSDAGVGSGFIVSEDSYIVTNFHVVKDAKFVTVKMIEDNKYFTGVQVVKVNSARDIALLKINNASGLPSVTLGDSDNVKTGERVVAIGNPEGFENTISDGLVSGIREFNDIKLIQTSVPVTHGSSGGPLLNMEGEVIGVVTSGFEKEGNINFAVPINYVKEELL